MPQIASYLRCVDLNKKTDLLWQLSFLQSVSWMDSVKVHFRLQLAEWYALGVTGDFNYAEAIDNLKKLEVAHLIKKSE